MGPLGYFCYLLALAGLFAWVLRLRPAPQQARALLLLAVAALAYDNGVCSAGFLIGTGQALKALNILRFILHVFVTPLVCVLCLELARAVGVPAALHRHAPRAVWGFTAALMAVGFMQDIASWDFVPKTLFGVLTYTHPKPAPPLAAIAVNFFSIATGVCIWRKTGWPVLLITSLLMLGLAGVPHKYFGLMPGNAGEVIFMAGFALLLKKAAPPGAYGQGPQRRQ